MFWTALIIIGIILCVLFLLFIYFSCLVLCKIASQADNELKNKNINSSPPKTIEDIKTDKKS